MHYFLVFLVFVDVVVQLKSFRSCFKFYLHLHVKLVFGYGNNDMSLKQRKIDSEPRIKFPYQEHVASTT